LLLLIAAIDVVDGVCFAESGYGRLRFSGGLMAEESLISKVQNLSDLELATLICLIAQEHCIIDTDPSVLDDLVQELKLVNFVLYD
jgi:hypothetical protein